MNGGTENSGTEHQVLVSQALLEEMQRQLQGLQAAALHATPQTTPPVTPLASERLPAGQHLKPNRPTRSNSGTKDYTTIENWITSVNSYFALTGAKPPHIYHYLNTIFTEEAAIWFWYHYQEDQAGTLT